MYTNETSKANLIHKALKYPFHGGEKRLIDKFLIIGYDFPTLKRELTNQTLKTDFNQNFINNEMIFPKIPKCYLYRRDNNCKNDKFRIPKSNCIVFNSNPHEGLNKKRSLNCLSYNFYKKFEKEIDKVKYIYLIPISFCFISEYPFYYSFSLLAFQIKNLFEREKLDIPLELILYNMVAFTPSPINHVVTLNIVPIKFNSDQKKIEEEFEIVDTKKPKFDILNTPEITFPILSGYPLMQFNLFKVLFSFLTPQLIIEIFIFFNSI